MNWLCRVAILEGISYLLFGITMPLKYLLDIPEPNYVVGMAHGFLFIAYVALVIFIGFRQKWSWKLTAMSLVAALLPFATFYMEKRYFRSMA